MSVVGRVTDEIKRSPLAIALNAFMAVVGAASLWIGGSEPGAPAVSAARAAAGADLDSAAIWLTIALFLSAASVSASMVRWLYRASRWAAVLISIPGAVLSLFLTAWGAHRFGIDVSEGARGTAFSNLIFYGNLIIYLAIAGGNPLLDFARSGHQPVRDGREANMEVAATLLMLLIVIAAWSWSVAAGQTAATRAFLSMPNG
jgi:hypothetical protein